MRKESTWAARGAWIYWTFLHTVSLTVLLIYDTTLHQSLFGENTRILYAVMFFSVVTLNTILYILVSLKDPGVVSKSAAENYFSQYPLIQSSSTPDEVAIELEPMNSNQIGTSFLPTLRYCQTCNIHQPLRTKHCHDCEQCIARFDHHCFWIGNCVGQKNHCIFYHYLLTQGILCIWSLIISVSGI